MDCFSPKATVILANGEKPEIKLFESFLRQKKNLIALDGAALWLLDHGIIPDLVIGDMDSLHEFDLKKLRSIYVADQETNDLEKALEYCMANELREIALFGAFGLRADHFLTNIAILGRFAKLKITMLDNTQCAFICPTGQQIALTLPIGSFVSLFPLKDEVGPIWSLGVDYPLTGELLSISGRLGTLNRINSANATLFCEKGPLLVLVPRT